MNAPGNEPTLDELMADLKAAAHYAVTGEIDPEVLRRIEARAARLRAELLRQHGTLDVAVSLIREIRDEE
jgi:hypothetical protein